MNYYLYNVVIFDTSPKADLSVFPRTETHSAIAETKSEAQRKIVEKLFAEDGLCARHSTPEDSPSRFNIVFDDLECEEEVVWDEEQECWVFALDEKVPEEVRLKQKAWSESRS